MRFDLPRRIHENHHRAAGSYFEETGDLTETNESDTKPLNYFLALRHMVAGREASFKLRIAHADTCVRFAHLFVTGTDVFRTRREDAAASADNAFDVPSKIKLVDGLISQCYTTQRHLDMREIRYWANEAGLSYEQEQAMLDASPKLEERRQAKLEEFKQGYPDIHAQLQTEFDTQLTPYYTRDLTGKRLWKLS